MEILSGGHRGGFFDEIRPVCSEICRKVAHILGCKYKLEQVLPRWSRLITVKILR